MGILIDKFRRFMMPGKDERELWRELRCLVSSDKIGCIVTYNFCNLLAGKPVYIFHQGNEVVALHIEKNTKNGGENLDELADDEPFSRSEPLWFSSCSHRISPVCQLRTGVEALSRAALDSMEDSADDMEVYAVFITNSNIINFENYIEQLDGKTVVIHNVKDIDEKNQLKVTASSSEFLDEYLRMSEENLLPVYTLSDICPCDEDDEDGDDEDEFDDDDDDEFASTFPSGIGGSILGDNPFMDTNVPSNVEVFEPMDNPMNELSKLIGLQEIKDKIRDFSYLVKYNQRLAAAFPDCKGHKINLHAVFMGNPGTGKTTMGRIWAGILKELGLLSKGHLVLASRATFVGSRWGEEEEGVRKVLELSKGGVLLIDEAYSLVSNHPNDPGRLVLPLLLNALADESRRDFSIVLAGYPVEMNALLKTNPGIPSRFANIFEFKDFSLAELLEITKVRIKDFGYTFTPRAWQRYREVITEAYRMKDQKHFGNGRFVANIMERIYVQHAVRAVKQNLPGSKMRRLTVADIVPFTQSGRTLVNPPVNPIGFRPIDS